MACLFRLSCVRYVTKAAAEAAGSPLWTSAEFVFDGVLPAYAAGQAGDAQFKHIANLNIIILTKGVATIDVQTETLAIAKDLAKCGAPKAQVGLQFVQVGKSVEGGALLHELDNDILFDEPDMVDTVRYAQTRALQTHRMTDDGLYKVLLGGVSRKVDTKRLENGHFIGKNK
ncbi:hypothetical protein G7054_g6507 [Neopestalotiopsis clavispora]|nr:hypothetical protein G7054_g6507 [Neopestalotiopsis clavispora]